MHFKPTVFFDPFAKNPGNGSQEKPFNDLRKAWLAVDNLWNQKRIKYIVHDARHGTDTSFEKTQQILKIIRHEIFYEISDILKSAPNSLHKRIEILAKFFLESPYMLTVDRYIEWEKETTLVEESMRLESFDCLTYVEIVLALALTKYNSDPKKLLSKYCDNLRHIMFAKDKPTSRYTRHRFVDSEWVPSNSKIVKEVTAELGEVEYKIGILDKTKLLDYEKKRYSYEFTPEIYKSQIEPLPYKAGYIPASYFLENHEAILQKISTPHIVTIIREKENLPKLIGSEYNITHLGFLLPEDNQWNFYHATILPPMEVVCLPLVEYVKNQQKHMHGIGFLKILGV